MTHMRPFSGTTALPGTCRSFNVPLPFLTAEPIQRGTTTVLVVLHCEMM